MGRGGETQLLGEIERLLPADFSKRKNITYIEPFVGGGAVLLWMLQKYPNIKKAVINDINEKLILAYKVVKDKVEPLIIELGEIEKVYLKLSEENRKEYYLSWREKFNRHCLSDVSSSACFIFLNKTCYNGLYRVNSKGEFNVPHGRYRNPAICNGKNLRMVSDMLQKVEILCGDFEQTLRFSDTKTIFYFDPPYKPITKTSSFTSYTKDGFGDSEQLRLKKFCDKISKGGAGFIASNSDPEDDRFFDKLYSGYKIRRVSATRMINSKAESRGKLSELLITNIIND